MNNGPPPWFALQTLSRHEKMAATILGSKGFEYFLPLYKSKRQWSDRSKEVEMPLFPGYLFCRFDPDYRVPILSTLGVASIVSMGTTPAPVHSTEIENLRALMRTGLRVNPWPFVNPGDRVFIKQGPLAGLEGTVVTEKGEARLILSVTLLQRSVSVEIERDWARPTTPFRPRPETNLTSLSSRSA